MLSKKDREQILKIIKKGSHDARTICRANVLNMRGKGFTAIEISEALEISPRTVFNIQSNYRDGGLDKALRDDPRPGIAPKFDDSIKSQIVALVCSDPPNGFDRWTLDLIVKTTKEIGIVSNISRSTVSVILREHDLKPWQQKSWCIGKIDDDYIEKMEDVLKTYEKPVSKRKPLVCLDEKMVHLTEDIRPPRGWLPGRIKQIDYEYKRNGSANVFCAILPHEGIYINQVTEKRTKNDFAKFLASLERKLSNAEKIMLVMDNLNTHKEDSLIQYYGEREGKRIWNRFEVHYTPKHGSWLNQAELAINIYARQCLGKSRIPTIELLRKKTQFWNKVVNKRRVCIKWKFTRKKAREKFNYEKISRTVY